MQQEVENSEKVEEVGEESTGQDVAEQKASDDSEEPNEDAVEKKFDELELKEDEAGGNGGELETGSAEEMQEEVAEEAASTPATDHENKEESDNRPAGSRHRNEDDSDPRWRKRKKHAFIVSSAGKPIFTRYGDEEKLNPLFGVMCSLVSFVQDQDDSPRVIFAGKHKIVFLVRGAVYLVMVSRTMEPTSHLVSYFAAHSQCVHAWL